MRSLSDLRIISCSFAVLVVLSGSTAFAQSESGAAAEEANEAEEQTDAEEDSEEESAKFEDSSKPGIDPKQRLASITTGSLHPQMGAENAKLRRIKKKLAKEPSIKEVQKAALEFYDLQRGQIKRYRKQASSKSLLPKISVQYRKNMIETDVNKYDFIQYGDEVAGLDDITGDVDEFVAAGTWNLPKLVYNPEVLELASLRKLRERVLKEVTRLYYLRRRLKIGFMLNPPSDASTRARKQIRIDQTTAMINAITNGVFTEENTVK